MSQNATENFFVEVLNKGYVVTSKNQKAAKESHQSVEAMILDKVKSMISGINKTGINNISVSISVDENLPKCQ